jgi:hypothetical protein
MMCCGVGVGVGCAVMVYGCGLEFFWWWRGMAVGVHRGTGLLSSECPPVDQSVFPAMETSYPSAYTQQQFMLHL